MFLKNKISYIKYALCCAFIPPVIYFTSATRLEFYFFLFASFAIYINHLLLMHGVLAAFSQSTGLARVSGFRLFILFLLKGLLLVGGFYIGVQLVGDRIIIAVILYIYMLIALGISLRR